MLYVYVQVRFRYFYSLSFTEELLRADPLWCKGGG